MNPNRFQILTIEHYCTMYCLAGLQGMGQQGLENNSNNSDMVLQQILEDNAKVFLSSGGSLPLSSSSSSSS